MNEKDLSLVSGGVVTTGTCLFNFLPQCKSCDINQQHACQLSCDGIGYMDFKCTKGYEKK